MAYSPSGKSYVLLGVVALIVAVIIVMLMQPQNDTLSERIDNAAGEVGEGLEEAGEELDPHRTTGEKIGDAIEDFGDDIEDSAK